MTPCRSQALSVVRSQPEALKFMKKWALRCVPSAAFERLAPRRLVVKDMYQCCEKMATDFYR